MKGGKIDIYKNNDAIPSYNLNNKISTYNSYNKNILDKYTLDENINNVADLVKNFKKIKIKRNLMFGITIDYDNTIKKYLIESENESLNKIIDLVLKDSTILNKMIEFNKSVNHYEIKRKNMINVETESEKKIIYVYDNYDKIYLQIFNQDDIDISTLDNYIAILTFVELNDLAYIYL